MSIREQSQLLKRVLNTVELFALGYSDVSSTYYFSLGVIAIYSGPSLPFVMALGSVPLWVAGLAYAKLSGIMPEVGGAYYYVKVGLGDFAGFVAGWLLGFDQVLMMSYGALGFSNYLLSAIVGLSHAYWLSVSLALATIWMLALLNILGIKPSARFNLALVIVDLAGIFVLVAGGFYMLTHGAFKPSPLSLSFAPLGLAYALRGYIGIDVIAQSAGEAVRPELSVPRSILAICSLSTAVAVLASILAIYSGGLRLMATHPEEPFSALATSLFGPGALTVYISLSVALVMLLSINSGIVDYSRGIYRMSLDRLLPSTLSRLYPRLKTPYISIITASAIASIFAIPNDVELIVGSYGIASLATYALAVASLARLKRGNGILTSSPP